MKNKFAFFALILSLFFSAHFSFAVTPDQEKSFLDAYKKAVEGNDQATLESFLYTKNADPEALEFYKLMTSPEPGSKVSEIKLRDLTAEEKTKAAEVMPGLTGGKSKLPVAPTKKLVLKVEMSDANGKSTSTRESFIAEIDGKLLIPVPVTVN